MGFTVVPSVNAKTDTSGPSKNSSMTTVAPDAPNFPLTIMSVTACSASRRVRQISTPLPKARPSAFTTRGAGCVLIYSRAAESSVKVSYRAVGIPYRFIRSLAKALLPSRMAALALGPKQGIPTSFSRSTQPRTRGSSGVTTA